MRTSPTFIGPLAVLAISLFTLRVEAIFACEGWKVDVGKKKMDLQIDLRVKGKMVPSSPKYYIDEINLTTKEGITTGQKDCRNRPEFTKQHCWKRKIDPEEPKPDTKPGPTKPGPTKPGPTKPGPKPGPTKPRPQPGPTKPGTTDPKPGEPDYWVPNYEQDAGMEPGNPMTECKTGRDLLETMGWTCDHILELNFLKYAMESNDGACAKAVEYVEKGVPGASPDAEVRYKVAMGKFRNIRQTVNNPDNLSFHQGKYVKPLPGIPEDRTPEHFKTDTVIKWNRNENVPDTAEYVWRLGGLHDYINVREASVLINIGKAADDEIKRQFPGAFTNVHDGWKEFQDHVEAAFDRAIAADKKRLADEDAKKKQQIAANTAGVENCTPGAGGSTGATTTPTTRRFVRHLGFGAGSSTSATTPWRRRVVSSLTERAARRVTPRTGPHAPPARSCPCKQQPAKKQIPRSQVKTRPPPAKAPRRPQQIPPARVPTRPKQVAKRPANRPLRVPGKKAEIRRPSPKRKPKTVPRPTRKPKGKPRPRRGRR